MMLDDDLIRETLLEKSEVLPIPPGVWGKLEQGLPRPATLTWWDRTAPHVKAWWLGGLAVGVLTTLAMLFGGDVPTADRVPAGSVAGPSLTVEETAVVYAAGDQPTHFEYMDRIPKAALARRAEWRTVAMEPREQLNQVLGRFGYRLEGGAPGLGDTLYKGETVLQQNVSAEGQPVVNQNGDDFALVVVVPGEGARLLRSSGFSPWDVTAHLYWPAFAGSDLIEVVGVGERMESFAVLRNGRQVYQGALGQWGAELPLKRLAGWDGHWLVEVNGQVIVDGQSLNQQLGYAEIFDWHLIAGRPFFFFRQNGQIGISYDGKALPNRYDEVIHYKCCEPAAFNPAANDRMVWFHARKGDLWEYVEAGVYN